MVNGGVSVGSGASSKNLCDHVEANIFWGQVRAEFRAVDGKGDGGIEVGPRDIAQGVYHAHEGSCDGECSRQ